MSGERIGILGLGLIGGSLALALRGTADAEVWGSDRRAAHLDRALADGAIARACTEREIAACDVVVVCVPVIRSVGVLRRIGRRMRPGAILTDVGSVKTEVVAAGQEAARSGGAEFVGGHPIAGTENSGYPAADASLFRDRTVIVTPTEANTENALGRVERLWRTAGARTLRMDAPTHDRVFAYVSHLPHVVAYALVHAVATLDSPVPLGYSAGGFRDFTRIASSNPEMWKEIVLQNRDEVLRAIGHYRKNFDLLDRLIRRGDAAGLLAYFRKAKKTRDGI